MIRRDDYGNCDEDGDSFGFWFYGSMMEVLVEFCLDAHCLSEIMLLVPNNYRRTNARPLSPMRAAARYCVALNVAAAPVLMDEALVPVPVTLPLALPLASPVTMSLVSPVALTLLVAIASSEAAVIVNVAFHAVQV